VYPGNAGSGQFGGFLVSSNINVTTNNNCGASGLNAASVTNKYRVTGAGPGETVIYMKPGWVATTNVEGAVMFFGTPNVQYGPDLDNFAIDGGGFPTITSDSNTSLIPCFTLSSVHDVVLANIGMNGSGNAINAIAATQGSCDLTNVNVFSAEFYAVSAQSWINIVNGQFFNQGGIGIVGSSRLTTSNTFVAAGASSYGAVGFFGNNASWNDVNGNYSGTSGTGTNGIYCTGHSGNTITLTGTTITTQNSATVALGGCILAASNSTFTASGSQWLNETASTGIFKDAGGNTYSGTSLPTIASSDGFVESGGPAGTIRISAQLSGASACTASQTLFLFPYGQTASSTCASAVPVTQIGGFVASRAGTLQNLWFSATAGGDAGDKVTVYQNGSASIVTCTYATATTCSDVTHTISVAKGDLIGFAITTGVTDTTVKPQAQATLF
jgi:hypothetical protein